ncbi:hypothetical protein RB11339 [Rhodopirellula baltica SH 1]|uniref:Uncharacterized protein n=1 Tax=Rhodopirellula baltica (strain DSM 10527 / NCIMB 13988 / SH1) TaxID=243090 RepID=Q7UEG9_RHOBA|nr:hypothetical protein RB11339 [Rhodopirellula baltica SH 1]
MTPTNSSNFDRYQASHSAPPSRFLSCQSCMSSSWIWLTVGGGETSDSRSSRIVWTLPPLTPTAMPISSSHTPGSRTECFVRNESTPSLLIKPSVILRRQSSPALISLRSIQTTWPRSSRSSLIRCTSPSFES